MVQLALSPRLSESYSADREAFASPLWIKRLVRIERRRFGREMLCLAVRHDSKIRPAAPPHQPRRWISGLIVMVATAVAFVGFANVSLAWTLAISTAILIGLVAFLWAAGGK